MSMLHSHFRVGIPSQGSIYEAISLSVLLPKTPTVVIGSSYRSYFYIDMSLTSVVGQRHRHYLESIQRMHGVNFLLLPLFGQYWMQYNQKRVLFRQYGTQILQGESDYLHSTFLW